MRNGWMLGLVVVAAGGCKRSSQVTVNPVKPAEVVAEGPKIGACPVLPKDNVWNTPVDGLKKMALSDAYIESIGPKTRLHADFNAEPEYGIPYVVAAAGTAPVPVRFEYANESDPGPYPIPAGAPIEGGPESKGDRHVIVVDTGSCTLYELYSAYPQPDGGWKAGSGVRVNLQNNALRPEGWTSADAAGLPVFSGLVRYDEVASGEIHHALRFTVKTTQRAYVWPGRHYASKNTDVRQPPMGVRFRLRADFDVSRYSPTNQVILKAMQRYGMFLADNGGSMFFSGAPDARWDETDLRKLGDVKADDFDAVDESGLMVAKDSGAAKQ